MITLGGELFLLYHIHALYLLSETDLPALKIHRPGFSVNLDTQHPRSTMARRLCPTRMPTVFQLSIPQQLIECSRFTISLLLTVQRSLVARTKM